MKTLSKSNVTTCSVDKTIALTSYILKTFSKIVLGGIFKTLEHEITDTKFGFRNGIYLCFVDFEQVFDKIKHGKLVEILKPKNVDSLDIKIISYLY